jgi:hypothetical protein
MTYRICLLLAMTACLGFSGCAISNSLRPSSKNSQWNLFSKSNDSKKEKSDDSPLPQTMAAIWKDSVFEKPGTPSVRGFGARIFFYDEDNQAVKADGELIVYGFDDSNELKADNSKADRKYVFQVDKFQTHFSETDLGPSYSVWIPWEKVGGFRKTITLIPVFKTSDGRVIKSGQSINVLPGRNPIRQTAKTRTRLNSGGPSGVSQAGFVSSELDSDGNSAECEVQQAALEDQQTYNRIRTSTIKLTPNLASQLAKPAPSTAGVNRGSYRQSTNDRSRFSKSNVAGESTDATTHQENDFQPPADAPGESTRSTRPRVFGSPGSFR